MKSNKKILFIIISVIIIIAIVFTIGIISPSSRVQTYSQISRYNKTIQIESSAEPQMRETQLANINKIKDELNNLSDKEYYFKKDESISNEKVDYYSDTRNYFILEELKNKEDYIYSYNSFYEYTNENGFEFFGDDKGLLANLTANLNESSFKERDNVSDTYWRKDYIKYLGGRKEYIFTYNTKEHIFEEGKVIEFYDSLDIYSNAGYFKDGRINYILKIYCAPNLIVKIRPIEDYARAYAGQDRESADKNTEYMLDEIRGELFPRARKILKKCSVEPSFFDNFEVEENKYELSYYYWPNLPEELKKSDASDKVKDLFIFSNKNLKKSSKVGTSSGGSWWIIIW